MTATTLPLLSFLSLLVTCAWAHPAPALLQTRYREVAPSSKTGLAWPNGNSDNISQYYQTSKVSWYYTWGPEPVDDDTLEFVPMLWGSTQTSDFASSINGTISSKNVTTVLGMNEYVLKRDLRLHVYLRSVGPICRVNQTYLPRMVLQCGRPIYSRLRRKACALAPLHRLVLQMGRPGSRAS
jgi:hypothetical protein